jgi:hypothetical protein
LSSVFGPCIYTYRPSVTLTGAPNVPNIPASRTGRVGCHGFARAIYRSCRAWIRRQRSPKELVQDQSRAAPGFAAGSPPHRRTRVVDPERRVGYFLIKRHPEFCPAVVFAQQWKPWSVQTTSSVSFINRFVHRVRTSPSRHRIGTKARHTRANVSNSSLPSVTSGNKASRSADRVVRHLVVQIVILRWKRTCSCG